MDKNNELANILRAELILLAKDILQNIHRKDLKSLYKATRQLQEKMAAIMVLKDQLDTMELMEILHAGKTALQSNDNVSVENKSENVAELKDDSQQKVKKEPEKTVDNLKKDGGKEQKKQEIYNTDINPYKQVGKMRFVPKGQKEYNQQHKSSARVFPLKKINIGLNDKISFIKHLFDGDREFYTRFIDTLNAFDDYEEALKYVNQKVKPQFNNWEGKDEYEFRLLQLLELKFV